MISTEPSFSEAKFLDFDRSWFTWIGYLSEMKFKILRIMSYAAMSEALWLWRYKQNSVENRVFWKICVLPKKSRCANSFERDCNVCRCIYYRKCNTFRPHQTVPGRYDKWRPTQDSRSAGRYHGFTTDHDESWHLLLNAPERPLGHHTIGRALDTHSWSMNQEANESTGRLQQPRMMPLTAIHSSAESSVYSFLQWSPSPSIFFFSWFSHLHGAFLDADAPDCLSEVDGRPRTNVTTSADFVCVDYWPEI